MTSRPPSSQAGASSSTTNVEIDAPQASDYLSASIDASGSLENLCKLCRDLFSGSKKLNCEGWWHETRYPHRSIADLFDSKQDSCRVCRFLRSATMSHSVCQELRDTESFPSEGQASEVEFETPYSGESNVRYRLSFWYRTTASNKTGLSQMRLVTARSSYLEYSLPGLTNNLHQETSNIPVLSSNTSSEASLGVALRWLKDCTFTHDTCNKTPTGVRRLPTRLVEINDDRISLRSSRDLPLDTKYCTLSHCWGGLTIPQLTEKAHFSSPDAQILLSDLPLTFQHAMDVAKRIGVNYIWIDSLCIIQDSYRDWLHESAQMCSVFSNSYCTIAATASTDARGGLFCRRDPLSTAACKIRTSWDALENDIFQFCGPYEIEWCRQVVDGPLGKRGWVLQERLLSPRVLHFGDTQLYWECKQLQASETNPEGLPVPGSQERIKSDFDMLRIVPDQSKFFLKTWRAIVKIYSNCNLTQGSDKLVAISGIAEGIHEALNGQDAYLAGLWKSELPQCLMWRVFPDSKGFACPRPSPYRAPTWSWASLDVPVILWESIEEKEQEGVLVVILEASTILEKASGPELPSPFGPVNGGMIRVRGLVFRASILAEGGFDDCQIILYAVRADIEPPQEERVEIGAVFLNADEGLKGSSPEIFVGRNFHCLVFSYEPGDDRYVTGLLLEPTISRNDASILQEPDESEVGIKGQFTRFGTFWFWDQKSFLELLMSDAFGLDPNVNFEEYNGKGEYTITII